MPGRNSTVNRSKRAIERERQTRRSQRIDIIVSVLKIAAYVMILFLAYPYIANLSFFKSDAVTKKDIADQVSDEPEIEYNFYTLLPGERTIEPPPKFSHTAQKDLSSVKSYMVQVGSFKTLSRSNALVRLLKKYKFKNIVVDTVKLNNITWHRVSLGPIKSLKRAKEYRANLSLKGIYNSVIKTKDIN